MVLAGSPAEVAALEDFQTELARILAGDMTGLNGGTAPTGAGADNANAGAGNNDTAAPQASASPPSVSYQPTIPQLPPSERPRERLREHGPRYLNNAELVAILLRSGIAGENAISQALRIIAEFDGLGGLAPRRVCRAAPPARHQRRQNQRHYGRPGAGPPHRVPRP